MKRPLTLPLIFGMAFPASGRSELEFENTNHIRNTLYFIGGIVDSCEIYDRGLAIKCWELEDGFFEDLAPVLIKHYDLAAEIFWLSIQSSND